MSSLALSLDRKFKLTENNTTVKKEFMAGTVTFATMAYILAVNPSILSASGMDSTAVMLATCLASAIGTFCMGMMANLPFALSAGMGLNAFFAYSVVIGMGYAWEKALLAVFVEGVIFIILSRLGVREAIFNAIPHNVKVGVSIGIGLFIAFIGMQNVGLIVADGATLVTMADLSANFATAGITILLCLIGVALIIIMMMFKVPGAMLIGIVAVWVIGGICEATGVYVPDVEAGYYSLKPVFAMTDFSTLGLTFGKCFAAMFDFHGAADVLQFVGVVISFLFVDIFDTMGTLTGGAMAADMLDENDELPQIRGALTADAVGTTAGAILGTSTITTFVESLAGILAGGRTGLTAMVTGFWFLVATFASSIFTSIPSYATASALIVVGGMMMANVTKLKVTDKDGQANYLELIPVFLCVAAMPICYSISEGIAYGVISYVVLNLGCHWINQILKGSVTLKDKVIPVGRVSVAMVVIAVVFALKYYMSGIMILLQSWLV